MKKRILAGALALCLAALLLPLGGCDSVESPGRAVLETYMRYIREGDYASAYTLLSASVVNDTEEAAAGRITQQEFIDKYTNIFSALDITAVAYENVSFEEGEIMTAVTYTGTLLSSFAGALTGEYRLVAVREGGEWRVEWSPALIFPDMEWGDTVRVVTVAASRGEIMADGRVLAGNVGVVSVYIQPSCLTEENKELALQQLSRLLGMTQSDITKKLKSARGDLAILKQFYPDELSATLRSQLESVDGVGVNEGGYGTVRDYPCGSLLAHTVGYVGAISGETEEALQQEIDDLNAAIGYEAYTTDSLVGKLGLEKQYETLLRGRDGKQIYIGTADGKNRRTLYLEPAMCGEDIQLTVDMDLQQRLEEVMQLVLFGDTTAGAVVVLNPLTGEIQAMCSYPTYDLNLFARGISGEDYNALLNNEAKPLINRVTQGRYPPGSVFKAFTAAATVDNAAIDTGWVFDGKIEEDYWIPASFGNWTWSAIKRTAMNYRTEPLNMHNAILNSDNIYFAYAALKLGEERFVSYMDKLGFSETVPFDISVASAQMLNEDTEWTLKFLADSGYGQGEILMTPLQLAAAFSAFANGGSMMTPRIIRGFYQENGIKYDPVSVSKSETWKQNAISQNAVETILPMLKDVVRSDLNGTGRKLKVTSCTVAAKTGTAEIGNDKSREIAWFAGFRTGVADQDARLVIVMLEVPAESAYSDLKFDIAREMLKMETPTDPAGT